MIKILVADDEGYEREILAEILDKRFGRETEVRMVENGRLAVDAAALWAADVALLDIEMPGINGIGAARQILSQRPECKIIFITAYSLFTYAHEAVKLGACDYILNLSIPTMWSRRSGGRQSRLTPPASWQPWPPARSC